MNSVQKNELSSNNKQNSLNQKQLLLMIKNICFNVSCETLKQDIVSEGV